MWRAAGGIVAAMLLGVVNGLAAALAAGVYFQTRMLRNQAHRLTESEQVRLAFLRGTSHELRTPLNAVAGYAGGYTERIFEVRLPRDLDAELSTSTAVPSA